MGRGGRKVSRGGKGRVGEEKGSGREGVGIEEEWRRV